MSIVVQYTRQYNFHLIQKLHCYGLHFILLQKINRKSQISSISHCFCLIHFLSIFALIVSRQDTLIKYLKPFPSTAWNGNSIGYPVIFCSSFRILIHIFKGIFYFRNVCRCTRSRRLGTRGLNHIRRIRSTISRYFKGCSTFI